MDQASFSLDSLSDNTCPHCGKSGQLVSHGYAYKRVSNGQREIAGKRILCSPHHGKRGCGRTHQWYLADVVPGQQYRLTVFIGFINALLGGNTVDQAYLAARAYPAQESRHAWRWLQRFLKQLSRWRARLSLITETLNFTQRSSTLSLVLPTLQALKKQGDLNHFQVRFQHRFC